MGFEKTFTDADGDTLRIRVYDFEAKPYVSLRMDDSADGEYALHDASPKRARKIALALLAAADVAEGVDPYGDSVESSGDVDGEFLRIDSWDEEGAAFAVIEGADRFASAVIQRKDVKRLALHLLRLARAGE